MSAILSFLGGSAFRAIWGEVAAWFTKRQEAKLEITRMKVQGELDAAQHTRNLESLRLQADLGVKEIRVRSEADLAKIDAQSFGEAIARANAPSGIKWVDAWNGMIRPAFGSLALCFIVFLCWKAGPDLTALEKLGVAEVMFSIVGFYFVDRTLKKAGK